MVPALPKASPKETKPAVDAEPSAAPAGEHVEPAKVSEDANGTAEVQTPDPAQVSAAPAKPRLWAGLFSKAGTAAASTSSAATASQALTNGSAADGSAVAPAVGSFARANASSLAQALQAYRPSAPEKLAFLEPRGLVNTGNMCYMNSVRASFHSRAYVHVG